jgi:putative transposase
LRELIQLYLSVLPVLRICDALRYPRASYYRDITSKRKCRKAPVKRNSPRKLSDEEQRVILDVLNSERFRDMAPAEIYTILLDEGRYYCSVRTMYRILSCRGQTVLRRQRAPRNYSKPELLATKPNQLWSWDITKLKGPAKWQYYLLYKIIDVYSRYIVGWLIAERESEELACELILESILRQEIVPGTLTIHADRGSSMKSNSVARLLCDLQVRKTHSRPHVSNDNPFSETAFKTLKYRPDFPQRFGSIHDARAHCRRFVKWYNAEHRHIGIAMLTPEQVHFKCWKPVLENRQKVLEHAVEAHPQRFVKGVPTVESVPHAVWINKPDGIEKNDNEIIKLVLSQNY